MIYESKATKNKAINLLKSNKKTTMQKEKHSD